MTNAEMLALMMGRLTRTSVAVRATVLKELNEKIRQKERAAMLPWFLKDVWMPSTTTSVDYIALPSDYLLDDDDGVPEIMNTTVTPSAWTLFKKRPYEKLRAEYANAEGGFPEKFAIYGTRLYMAPTPNAAYAIRLPYFKRSSPVVDDNTAVSNPWLVEYFNYFTLSTVALVARLHLRDSLVLNNIKSELDEAVNDFMRSVEAREHAGQAYLLGDEEN